MQEHGYRDLAKIYDLINQKKDYVQEVEFLKILLKKYEVKTVLDVGCGTGTHMHLLEEAGFKCDGIDINQEMLEIAKKKVKGNLTSADMTNFNLGKQYDAIICMFAAFNYLLHLDDAKKAIKCFKHHLNRMGILLIDLHNPQRSGKKENNFKNISRKMEWNFNPKTKIEESKIIFTINAKEIKDAHTMKIYSKDEMLKLLQEAGFSESKVYEGYGFKPAQQTSKNLEIFSRL